MDPETESQLDHIKGLEAENSRLRHEVIYYRTMYDLEQVAREELESYNRVLRGELQRIKMDVTYPAGAVA